MQGINETKDLLNFGFKLIKGIQGAQEDGKFDWRDYDNFLPSVLAAPKAFGGINLVGLELADLDESEKAELMDFARQEFDLPNDKLEILIEDTLEFVLNGYKLAIRWVKVKE